MIDQSQGAALNFTTTCRCGNVKDKSRQWCDFCFNLLSEKDRHSFINAVWTIRKKITSLQVKMNLTLELEKEPVDLRNVL